MSYAVIIEFKNHIPRYAAKRLTASTMREARREADRAILALRRELPDASFEAQLVEQEDNR